MRSGGVGESLRAVRGGLLEPECEDDLSARVAWSAVVEPGDAVAGDLIDRFGPAQSLRLVQRADRDGPADILDRCLPAGDDGLGDALAQALARWRPRLRHVDVGAVLAPAVAVAARLVVPGDPDWPRGCDDLGPHAPITLWRRSSAGNATAAATTGGAALAVVGSRANTVAGAESCAEVTSAACDAGCVVVSGGAYGIDAIAHRVAIAAGTPTVAVLAGGIDQLYPAGNVELLRNVARQGAVVAESPPGTRPSRWRFLARNRLIAAMTDATVVVEAGARSGALNTAHHAAQLGRPVLAVPGAFSSPGSVGCHRLVASGRAQLAVAPADPAAAAVRAAAGVAFPEDGTVPLMGAAEDPEVVRALDALSRRRPLAVDEVARRSGLSLADTTDALALAELQGAARRTTSGWLRS